MKCIHCNKEVFVKKSGLCQAHFMKFKRYGDALIEKRNYGIGATKNIAYKNYQNMISRCYRRKNISYYNYGGRGIKVCDRWLGKDGFKNFLEDMGDRPSMSHSLDRLDSNGYYSPDNCKWSTRHQQNSNKRNNLENVGVFAKKNGSWYAYINVDNKRVSKTFKTFYEALEYRKKLEKEFIRT